MNLFPLISTTVVATVGGSAVAAASALLNGVSYVFSSSTNCWIRQGSSTLLTLVAKASLVDGETITIAINGATVIYEFDVNGTGVASGHVQVNVSADTTAANVAARLKTAINATQTTLTVTDPASGALTIDLPDSRALVVTEQVANAGCTVGTGIMQATAGTGSMFIPAGKEWLIDGAKGAQLGVIQDAAGGKSSTAVVQSKTV